MRVYEIKKNERIIAEDQREYRFLQDASYRGNKCFYTSVVKDSEDSILFVKFLFPEAAEERGEREALDRAIYNLTREAGFRFVYPYIARVIRGFEGVYRNEKVYGVCIEFLGNVEGEEGNESIRQIDLGDYRKKMVEEFNKKFSEALEVSEEYALEVEALMYEEMERKMFKYMLQLLHAVEFYATFSASGDDFVHRDIKPANIMFPENGDIVLVDFDYAHVADSSGTVDINRKECETGGTAGYLDPRIYDKKSDILSDIYSLGRTFFYMLNGWEYYTKEEKGEYCNNEELAYTTETKRFLKRYQNERFQKLINIIRRMCAREEERYHTVGAIIQDMKGFLFEYASGDLGLYEELLDVNGALLQSSVRSNKEKEPIVKYEVLVPGGSLSGKRLREYTMRDICYHGDILLTIYNVEGDIFCITPINGKRVCRIRDTEQVEIMNEKMEIITDDFQVYDGDIFDVGGVSIKFYISRKGV